jgi:hypothetical protein
MVTTEENARELWEISLEEQKRKYCPLIKDRCRADCECFDAGKVVKNTLQDDDLDWYYKAARCTGFK